MSNDDKDDDAIVSAEYKSLCGDAMQRWMYRGKSFVVTLRTYVVGHVTKRAQRVEEDKENPRQPFVQFFSVYIQHTTHTHTHTHRVLFY